MGKILRVPLMILGLVGLVLCVIEPLLVFLAILGTFGLLLAIVIAPSQAFPLWMKVVGGTAFLGVILLARFYRAERKQKSVSR